MWTAQDFEAAIAAATEAGKAGSPYYDQIAFDALRIAAAVMKPGVLGDVIMKQLGASAKPRWVEETVNAVRKALTETA